MARSSRPTRKTAAAKTRASGKAKTPAKKATSRKAVPKKAAVKKPAPPKKAPAKKPAPPKKPPAKKAPAKKTATKRTVVRKAPAPKKAVARPRRSAALDKFLLEQRELLVAQREVYDHQAETLRAEAEQLAEEMEPGDIQFDEESGEGATMNVERERDLALSAQARAEIEEIDRALAKIDIGTYGLCEQCGQPIPRPRLKALPYAALCVSCKSGGLSRR